MENIANYGGCFLEIVGESNSNCKQNVNSGIFLKILLIYGVIHNLYYRWRTRS